MSNQGKILVVEDEVFLRDIYVEVLTDAGFEVDFASDGRSALEKMTQGGYDLVLLDVMLPQMDGQEVMKALKKDPPKHKNSKVMYMTNLVHDSLLNEGKSLGVSGYITKSDHTPDQFVAAVKKALK